MNPADANHRPAALARHEALHTLIDRHRAEYDELHREARTKYGLPREPNNIQSLKAEVERLRALLADKDGA